GHRVRGTGDAAMLALKGDGLRAARQADLLGDLRDRADVGELLLVTGHEQHPLLVARVDGERERHTRKDDDVVERDEKKSGGGHQVSAYAFNSRLRLVSKS